MVRRITLLLAVAALTMMFASGCALADLIVNNDPAPAPTHAPAGASASAK